jgi:hypothetical protein
MSTLDYQDRASSQHWQHGAATDLIAEHGQIVAEYFAEGISRRMAWPDRRQAARLLAAIADPARTFDAIVVGEYERAFTGQQLDQLTPSCAATMWRYGYQKPTARSTSTTPANSRCSTCSPYDPTAKWPAPATAAVRDHRWHINTWQLSAPASSTTCHPRH